MYAEGLDNNAVLWNQVPLSNSNLRPSMTNLRISRGFDLPPPSKFRSGHLPATAIPVSRTFTRDAGDIASASENDMTTDSEDDVYGGRYSLDSSPQDPRIPHINGNSVERHVRYTSDYGYSDVSSSRETIFGRDRSLRERLMRGNGRTVYTEKEEESDSAASSEFSTTQVGSFDGVGGMRRRAYVSEGYTSSVASHANLRSTVKRDLHSRSIHDDKLFDDDEGDGIPSAPPFSGSAQEIKQVAEQVPAPRVQSATAMANIRGSSAKTDSNAYKPTPGVRPDDITGIRNSGQFARTAVGAEPAVPSGSSPSCLPTFHASTLGPWHAVIAYDACVRLCLHAWARGCMEAPMFLDNECALLREAFGLQQVLLQSEEELLVKRTSEPASERAAPKPKKVIGKMKVQVRKVKTSLDPPTTCSMTSLRSQVIKLESIRYRFSSLQSSLSSGWQSLRKIRFVPHAPANLSFSHQSLAYVHASTQYIKQVSGLLKTGVTSLCSSTSSYDIVQETYSCTLRLKSSTEEDAIRMQPGSGETHLFFPDSLGDDLIVEVQDSKGKHYGRVVAQVATIAEDPTDKLRWWSVFREPEHELVGKLQLYIYYSTSSDDNSQLKCGSVAETVAYDLVMEVAMKVQQFQQRNLLLYGSWKWLLTEFASYYGVSDSYTKLRYLSYIMDIATPTADCLTLVYDLLEAVIMKGHSKSTLSHQENRILGETKDQIEQILALAFENYKSLDESAFSGITDFFKPATGVLAPSLAPAVKLYTLLHDILSPEAQNNLCHYFQAAAKKRSRRHLAETDEFVSSNNEMNFTDTIVMATAYQKMTAVCVNIKNEIFTDIEIHEKNILPSFIDLPNLSSSIYSTELCSRLRAFLLACPPSGPSPHVAELIIASSDFQRDLASWNISPMKGGVDAKELFHLYILLWIQEKRLSLLESCKLDKVKWSGVRTQHSTTPFVDDVYDRLRETLNDYEVIISRWPEYVFVLENAIADVERAIVEALDKQYADVLAPLKENLAPKKFGLKYVQKLAKRTVCAYTVPDELGILLNSMKRMLDVTHPKIETQFKSWGSCIPDGGNAAAGQRLSEVTVMLRTKFRTYLQAVDEKLAENTKLQSATKLKKILQDSKETVGESDIRVRMQPLKDQLTNTINRLHTVFEARLFVAICQGYWDRIGQDVLSFLENRKENRSWYKGAQIAVSILDGTFASQMQQLLGNALLEKDLDPPRSITEVRSILCKDIPNYKGNTYYY
ncbi:uncharacterized protein LOC123228931 isoform X2 [Mangifera indica]|uniref:uncharacterized protein LOC123228931 isoform X2 n=1 Tax=Mangifera indica TaxID=29780 RepID=UPI001CFAC702|nr:uncharacterized protein LOC123228931 isoform X2 [Mangifera indica]